MKKRVKPRSDYPSHIYFSLTLSRGCRRRRCRALRNEKGGRGKRAVGPPLAPEPPLPSPGRSPPRRGRGPPDSPGEGSLPKKEGKNGGKGKRGKPPVFSLEGEGTHYLLGANDRRTLAEKKESSTLCRDGDRESSPCVKQDSKIPPSREGQARVTRCKRGRQKLRTLFMTHVKRRPC